MSFFQRHTSADSLALALNFLRTCCLAKGGLAIKAASSPDAKTASTVTYAIAGRLYSKAAMATVPMAAAGSLPAGQSVAVGVFLDAAGTVSVKAGSPAPKAAECVFPDFDHAALCPVGAVLVTNASASAMAFGTTALDAAGVTATYLDILGAVPGQAI